LVWVTVEFPTAFDAVKITEYSPGVLYSTTGFVALELAGVPPGNNQLNEEALEDDVLLNVTVVGAQPLLPVAVKLAIGGVVTTIV
jgi:hypothetical protein